MTGYDPYNHTGRLMQEPTMWTEYGEVTQRQWDNLPEIYTQGIQHTLQGIQGIQ